MSTHSGIVQMALYTCITLTGNIRAEQIVALRYSPTLRRTTPTRGNVAWLAPITAESVIFRQYRCAHARSLDERRSTSASISACMQVAQRVSGNICSHLLDALEFKVTNKRPLVGGQAVQTQQGTSVVLYFLVETLAPPASSRHTVAACQASFCVPVVPIVWPTRM